MSNILKHNHEMLNDVRNKELHENTMAKKLQHGHVAFEASFFCVVFHFLMFFFVLLKSFTFFA